MLDAEMLKSIAAQLMTSTFVIIGGKSLPVRRTSSQRFKTVAFRVGGHRYQAIEQNPEKPSRCVSAGAKIERITPRQRGDAAE